MGEDALICRQCSGGGDSADSMGEDTGICRLRRGGGDSASGMGDGTGLRESLQARCMVSFSANRVGTSYEVLLNFDTKEGRLGLACSSSL